MELFQITNVPKGSDIHVWSDFIELLCLINQDRLISASDVVDRLIESSNLDTNISEYHDISDQTVDESRNLLEQKTIDWFGHIEYRSGEFLKYSAYPFRLSEDRNTLYRRDELTIEQKFYIFLLLAANLKYVEKSLRYRITVAFEIFCSYALRQYLPEKSDIDIFGTSGATISRYRGNLWKKINILANDLSERVVLPEEKISPSNSGDDGLDIVGWIPLDDAPGMITVFGQCACTDEWVSKQHTSGHSAWSQRISLTVPPFNFVFIPFCYRDSLGGWHKPQDIHQSVVIDRNRLLNLLKSDLSFFAIHPILNEIEQIIDSYESLV